jgi:hypothetical protein
MRAKLLGTAGWVLGLAASAAAQQPGEPAGPGYAVPGFSTVSPQNVMPNIYNPRTQPLSPYLNLLRGGNPGVNYYYGVRPGTTGGAATFGAAGLAPGGSRPTSFPIQFTADDALVMPEPGEGYILPPAGHPTAFNNTMGYFPGPSAGGQRPRPGIGGGGGAQARPGARR